MHKIKSFLAVFLVLAVFPVVGQNFFAIITCDTLAYQLEMMIPYDMKMMHAEVQKIAKCTGMSLTEIILADHELTPDLLLETLDGLPVGSDDVVLFYFSGHGFRTFSKGDNKWPYLQFSTVGQGLDFDFITHLLKEKQPRLLLTIADCCNQMIPEKEAPPIFQTEYLLKKFDLQPIESYCKLFLESAGVIMVSASRPGELAWSTYHGAVFTIAFLRSLKTYAHNPDWPSLLTRAAFEVSEFQHPQFEILLN